MLALSACNGRVSQPVELRTRRSLGAHRVVDRGRLQGAVWTLLSVAPV